MQTVFQGYRRPDGQYGARNLVAVIPSVICANDVAQAICRQVQGTVGYFHHQGCCQLPLDLRRVTEVLINLGKSPNVAASLIVSLGCEGTDHERMLEELRATGKPVEIIRIQELGGTSRAIQAGIDAGADCVLVSHNVVESMDGSLPASLSPEVHRILRQELGFTGVTLTDDLAMDAVEAYAEDGSVAVLAVLAGNDMIVTTDFEEQIPLVIAAVESGAIDEGLIDQAVSRVLGWKYDLGLLG